MSSFTFADNKYGGRFTAAFDAIAANKLRTAASIFLELGNELNAEAEKTDGLLADELVLDTPIATSQAAAQMQSNPDTQSCARGAHQYGDPQPITGWRECRACGYVNVAPPDGGAIDMSNRALGDL